METTCEQLLNTIHGAAKEQLNNIRPLHEHLLHNILGSFENFDITK